MTWMVSCLRSMPCAAALTQPNAMAFNFHWATSLQDCLATVFYFFFNFTLCILYFFDSSSMQVNGGLSYKIGIYMDLVQCILQEGPQYFFISFSISKNGYSFALLRIFIPVYIKDKQQRWLLYFDVSVGWALIALAGC